MMVWIVVLEVGQHHEVGRVPPPDALLLPP